MHFAVAWHVLTLLLLQLQSMVTDEFAGKLVSLFVYESSRSTPFDDRVYHANACILLHDDPCYRFVIVGLETSLRWKSLTF